MHSDFTFLWYTVLGLLFSGHSVYVVSAMLYARLMCVFNKVKLIMVKGDIFTNQTLTLQPLT